MGPMGSREHDGGLTLDGLRRTLECWQRSTQVIQMHTASWGPTRRDLRMPVPCRRWQRVGAKLVAGQAGTA